MTDTTCDIDRRYRLATGILTFLGLYHGAVPLVARGLFDRDQRFAPALWLPAPWWWLACLAISALTLLAIVLIDIDQGRRHPTSPPTSPPTPPEDPLARAGREADERRLADRAKVYGALSGLVFLVGLYNGLAPFIARLLFGGDLLLALPLRLPSPWWWITSLAVIAATLVLLALIEHAEHEPRR